MNTGVKMNDFFEKNILEEALNILRESVDFEITNHGNDNYIEMLINDISINYAIKIEKTLDEKLIGFLLYLQTHNHLPQLLITEYVNPNMAEKLKKNNMQFIDIYGNMFIKNFPLYIYIRGNKPNSLIPKKISPRLFQPTGLKILYMLLTQAELINKSYREIAERAGVSLGSIAWVFKDLKNYDFLVDMGKKGKKLINKEELLKRWCMYYIEKLKPKLFIGNFRGLNNWKSYSLDSEYVLWSGEVAAYQLTQYIKPEIIALYIKENYFSNVMQAFKLFKDESGDIEIYKQFWLEAPNYQTVVHPIIIYADLLAAKDQRNIEVAKILYDKYIVKYIEEN